MNRLPSRRGIVALALGACGLAALPRMLFAQSADDPVETVKALYAKPQSAPDAPFMTRRLARLFAAQRARARRTSDVLAGLDFDYLCACQDSDEAFKQQLTYGVSDRTAGTATVTARFPLFNASREVVFRMRRENRRWLVDDIRGTGSNEWMASLLRRR